MTKLEACEKLRKAIELIREVENDYGKHGRIVNQIHKFMVYILENYDD